MDEERLRDFMVADLADLARTRMPFGKFGPAHFPPRGVPLPPPEPMHRSPEDAERWSGTATVGAESGGNGGGPAGIRRDGAAHPPFGA